MKKKLVMIVTSLILLIASLSTMGIAHANQNKTPDTRETLNKSADMR